MNKSQSMVSVIMGVNRDDGSLLRSIESILCQTHNDLEFIIVNDGSSEDVKGLVGEILDDRIVLINSAKIGLTAALNIALKKSKGKYIARHDAGDYSSKDRFNEQIKFLKQNPAISMCGSWIEELSSSGTHLGITPFPTTHSEIQNRIPYQNVFCHGSIMARKDDFMRVNGYREEFKHSQDYDLWLRYIDFFKVANLKTPLYKRIISPDSISFANKEKQKQYADLARNCYLARKAKMNEPIHLFENINKTKSKLINQKKIYSGYKFYCGRRLYANGKMRLARKYFFSSLFLDVLALKNIIYIFFTFLPKNLRIVFEKIWFKGKEKYNLRIE